MGAGLCLPLPVAAVANAVQQANAHRSTAHCLLSEGILVTGERRLFRFKGLNVGLGVEFDTTGPKNWEKHQIRVKNTYLLDSAEKIGNRAKVQGPR